MSPIDTLKRFDEQQGHAMNTILERNAMERGGFAQLNTKLEPAAAVAVAGFTAGAAPATCPLPSLRNQETGLPFDFLVDLALKTLFHGGRMRLRALNEQLHLPMAVVEPLLEFLRGEGLCEVAAADPDRPSADVRFQLSAAGRQRADTALQKCGYVGPAPVSLESYVVQVERQSNAEMQVTPELLGAAFAGLVLQNGLGENLGAALNSGRPILMHGPSGSGKTFISEHLVGALGGHIYVPHAILVDAEVIQVFDPLVHHAVGAGPVAADADLRWVQCRRPVVMSGGELTLSTLDLKFDERSRFYVAPPQVKANNGLFIIDDLGRQQVSPRDLMNRWIVPLDRRIDHFVLHTGKQFEVPFHLKVIFSSNLRPADLADDAFLRRLGYKIHVGEMSVDDYRSIFVQACERAAVPYAEESFDYLLCALHARGDVPLLACTPFDLVSMVRDRAAYRCSPPLLSEEALDWAWQTYFAVN